MKRLVIILLVLLTGCSRVDKFMESRVQRANVYDEPGGCFRYRVWIPDTMVVYLTNQIDRDGSLVSFINAKNGRRVELGGSVDIEDYGPKEYCR